jgi:Ca2+-binding RTX toxin-like protein
MKKKRGTAGIDELNGTRRADEILGLDGNDVISGRGGNDKLRGGEGTDEIRGGGGADRIFGDGDDDFLFGESGSDVISGGDGKDIIIGGGGNDVLKGGAGNDRLFSNTGNDRMNGGDGDDYYEIGYGTVETVDDIGNDEYKVTADSSVKIDDRNGHDKLRFADTDKSWTITMNDLMFQRSGDDLVITVDGYKGETTITFFYAEEENYRIERIYNEEPTAKTGYNLEIENILNLSNGDEPIRGTVLWEL